MPTWRIEVEHRGPSDSLSAFVRDHIPGVPRQRLTQLVERGAISVDQKVANNPGARVHEGTLVAIELTDAGDRKAFGKRGPRGFRPLFVDEHIVVVDKFWGLLSVPRHDDDTQPNLCQRVAKYFELEEREVGAAHRLDRFTSGVMIVMHDVSVRPYFVDLFANHDVERRYAALVRGRIEARDEPLVHWLRDDPRTHHQTVVSEGTPEAVRAALRYQVIAATDEYSHVEVELETGRRNQIRVQLADIGHPLIGERVYAQADASGLQRHALHASSLRFVRPGGGRVTVTASLAPDLERWMVRG